MVARLGQQSLELARRAKRRKDDRPNTRTLKPTGMRHPFRTPLGHPPFLAMPHRLPSACLDYRQQLL